MRTDLASPYDWTTNRPDENSKDFKNVMNWLVAHGAPRPDVLQIALDPTGWIFPGSGTFPGSIMMLNFAGDPLPHDAAQVLNSPGVLLKELGLSPGGDINYAPPAPPAPAPVPPSTHIGQRLNANWYAQVDPDSDPAENGKPYQGPDGRTYIFRKGIVGGWYELVRA